MAERRRCVRYGAKPKMIVGESTPAVIPAHFERAVTRHPGNVAVRCRLGAITYLELNEAAERLADRLLETGRVGDRVALLMPQDRRIFVAMIGALKAGRIVFVLNSRDPPARLRQLLVDGDPGFILTVDAHEGLAGEIAAPRIEILNLDRPLPAGARPARPAIDPYDTAFLVYTSGSTGQPKGVMQTHGHTLRDVLDLTAACEIVAGDRILLLASLWGAQAVNTTWNAFANGAALTSFPAVENGVAGLARWLVEERVTFFIAASSLFRTFVRSIAPDARFPDIRLIKLSADAATREDFEAYRRHFPNAVLMNAMGCSETGHLVTIKFGPGSAVRDGPLPVGRPFADVGFNLLDEGGKAVPQGTVGTISARIRHMAAGYWRDAELTARHFAIEPDGMRVFRSADVAAIDADGNVVFAGRQDATYKIRGQRVDLAEVERGVAALPGVGDGAVIAAPRPNGDLELVAFTAPAAGVTLSSRKLRAAARAVMPRSFVPASFVVLDALPRAGNGKVDRGQLRALAPAHRATNYEAPATPTETMLAGLWAEAFDLGSVGREDEFFDLGGDSLIATMIAARLHAERGASADFGAFVEQPILKDFAAWLDGQAELATPEDEFRVEPARRGERVPMSFLQDDFWRDSHQRGNGARHTRAAVGRIEGPLDVATFRRSLDEVVARHAILRTTIQRPEDHIRALRRLLGWRSPRPRQLVHPPSPVDLPLTDLSGLPIAEAERRAAAILEEAGHHVFPLNDTPPIRFQMLRLRPDLHHFIQTSHHILTDGPSWRVFAADLAAFYEHHRGLGPRPEPLPFQFGDYARWEAERWRRRAPRLVETVGWWRSKLADVATPPRTGWLSLPGHARVREWTPADWSIAWGLDQETLDRLDALARASASTFFTVRLAAVAVVLAAAIGQERVVLSAASTQRTRVELNALFGPFANVVPLLITCRPGATFRDIIAETRHLLLESKRRVEMPSALLREELGPSSQRAAILPTFWVHMPTPVPPVEFAGLRMSWGNTAWYPRQRVTTFLFDPVRGGAGDRLDFDPATHSAAQMRALVAGLAEFMRRAAANPSATLAELLGEGLGEQLRSIGTLPAGN